MARKIATVSQAPIRLSGNIGRFSASKASGDGKPKSLSGKLCVPEPDLELISRLCQEPMQARKAMEAAARAKAKVEVPARKDEYVLRYFSWNGKNAAEVNELGTLKKIVYDGTKAEPLAEVHYSEPLLLKVAAFMLEHLGADIQLELEMRQKRLDIE